MTISIGDNKPATPVISITGTQYDESTTVSTSYSATAVSTVPVKNSENSFTKSEILTFLGDISFTVAASGDNYTDATYPNTTADFVGKKNMGSDNIVGDVAETFYTLNGKDPKRTKNYLYKGSAITLTANKSGSDNTIIKARRFAAGQWSDVAIAEIKIVRSNENAV
jgi:hypothetical protein